MDQVLSLLNAVKNITFEQIIKAAMVAALILWVSTEGREVWLEANENEQETVQTELLTNAIGNAALREERQEEFHQEATITLQLMQQKMDLEIQDIKDDITRLEGLTR